MWASILDAITQVSGVGRKVMDRLWGDQTREAARLDAQAADLERQYIEAIERRDADAANRVWADRLRVRDRLAAIRRTP